jgi:hypothetical protein
MQTNSDSDIEYYGKVISADLVFSTMPLNYKNAFFGAGFVATEDGATILYRISTKAGVTDEDWKLDADNSGQYKSGEVVLTPGVDIPRWANHDILYTDGSLKLAASNPFDAETGEEIDVSPIIVPVPVTDHNARIQGWIAGKRLAAQRGRA